MAHTELPLVAPGRKVGGFRPFKVLHHFGKLIDDKEDTEQVFHIIAATQGKAIHQQAWDFIGSPEGQRLIADADDIPTMLDHHARWANCAPNSVAAHYIAFMKREGLTAAGLVAESHRWAPPETLPRDQTQWYLDRLRDTHDLFHVLTGYGRDALGEVSLLGFTYQQNYNKGILFIAYAGARQIKKVSGTAAPLYAAIREGRRLGRTAAKIAHQDIAALMHEDIDAARTRLHIGSPDVYRRCLAILQNEGTAREQLTLGEAKSGTGAKAA